VAEHLTLEQVNTYVKQRLTPTELIEVDAHLAECEVCRNRLEAALPASAVALYSDWQREAAPEPHLSAEQMADYVDDTLNHAETLAVSDHLATCHQCAHEINDLRKFAATEAVPKPVVVPSTSWWEKLREWMSVPAVGWAMAALLLVVLAGWLMRMRPTEAPQIVQQGETPTPLPVLSPTPNVPEIKPLLAQLNDGGNKVMLDEQGNLSGVAGWSPDQQQLVKSALTTQRLERPAALADLQRRGSSLMGADDQGHRFALQAPTGKVVLSERPTFKWSPLAGATSYVVEVYDEQFNLVAQSEAISQARWTPPRPLVRGKVYAWQVKATKAGQTVTAPAPPAPQARFRVVASNQAQEINHAKRTEAHLPLALLYLQAGLLDEAEAEFRTLQKANPESEIVRRWLSQVAAMRR
jgi:hypothetical protein